ncbi:hypothetical protein MTR67_012822 [Solanum verrucosum]|uniref:Uncharacterized protein n=1 Tax=Solanum verrucosum TaxID=315347 RepID=A0AAF0Q9E7_SOLVR|nr:hypothetical protein MTR67_012822 [Solanum verrucosum]
MVLLCGTSRRCADCSLSPLTDLFLQGLVHWNKRRRAARSQDKDERGVEITPPGCEGRNKVGCMSFIQVEEEDARVSWSGFGLVLAGCDFLGYWLVSGFTFRIAGLRRNKVYRGRVTWVLFDVVLYVCTLWVFELELGIRVNLGWVKGKDYGSFSIADWAADNECEGVGCCT